MDEVKLKPYLTKTRKRFDPLSILVSLGGLAAVVFSIAYQDDMDHFLDPRSALVVVCGTFASVIFQFDLKSFFIAITHVGASFWGSPGKSISNNLELLDEAILRGMHFTELKDGSSLNGDLLNDMVYMHRHGLLKEEIEDHIKHKINDHLLIRKTTVELLKKASIIAPALGLFGTVIGLIGVLRSLSDPTMIGPSMSLALMTTAYGAALGSLIFTPLAGRVEHHNTIYFNAYKQLVERAAVLIRREEVNLDEEFQPEIAV